MTVQFTDIEKKLLEGQSGGLARKHNCSHKYVRFIIQGERNINTDLAKKIYEDCKAIIALLSPKPPKEIGQLGDSIKGFNQQQK